MKRFTLIVAMLFCVVGFSQEIEVKNLGPNNPSIANKAVANKQVKADANMQVKAIASMQVKAESTSNESNSAYSSFTEIPEEAYAGIASRAAVNAVKFTAQVVPSRTTSDDPMVMALLERLSNLGVQAGSPYEHFSAQEVILLRNHFAGKESKIFNSAAIGVPSGNNNFSASETGVGTRVVTPEPQTRNPGVVITHSVSQDILPGNSVTCNAAGIPTLQSFFRAYDLAGDFGISSDFIVSDVEFGVETVSGPVDLTLNVWSSSGAPFPNGTLTLQGSAGYTSDVADTETVVSVPVAAIIPAGDEMIFELVIDDLAVNSWFPGSNADGQTDVSYILADACGISAPTDLAAIGFPDQHMVMNVVGKGDTGGGGGGTPVAYAWESQGLGYGSMDPADPSAYTTISPGSGTPNFEGAGAIDPNDTTTGYAADNVGLFWSVDVATGVYTSLGDLGVADITGLEFNPVDGTLYAATSTALYTVDPGVSSATLVGNFSTAGLAVALAIDGSGNGYTYDLIDDSFYTVDLATGATTLVGSIGFDANFGQGLAWDVNTDQVYMAAFNNGLFDAEIRTVDVATGNTTLVGQFLPGTLNQLAWFTVPEASGGGGGGGCTAGTFTDRTDFETSFGGTLVDEDLDSSDPAVDICSDLIPISIAGNACYPAGDVVDGVEIYSDVNGDVVTLQAGGPLGNTVNLAGANGFADATTVTFLGGDVNAFGADLILPLAAADTDITVEAFGASGLLESTTILVPTGPTAGAFVGMITDDPIEFVVITAANDEGELIANLSFGSCVTGGGGGTACSQSNPSNGFENGFFTGSGPTAPQQLIAGDIIVPADTDFSMTTINANLMVNPGETVATADLIIYDNVGGFPGAEIANYAASVPSSQVVLGTAFGFDVLDVSFDIPATDLAGQAGSDTTYWLSIYIDASDGGDGLWEASSVVVGLEAAFSVDNGATWAGYASPFDVVYTYAGDCTPIGGGGGNDCSLVGPGNAFENGKSCTQNLGRIVAHDIAVPADQSMMLEVINANMFIGAEGSGTNAAFVDIYIWGDNGGQPDPGNVIATVPGFVPTNQTVAGANFGFDVWNVELDHPDVMLDGQVGSPTTYWIGLSLEATDGSNVFWENSTAGLIGNGEAYDDGAGGGFVIDATLEGVYTFTASCEDLDIFTYDDCEGALDLDCGMVVQGSTIGATDDSAVAPDCDTPTTTPGVWYKFEDTSGLAADITITTCSALTDYDTKISVYTGECSNPPLTCVVGNDDDPDCTNFQSTVEFSTTGDGTTYYILVHGFGGQTGNFELTMTCDLIPPPNDDIENAIDLDEVGCPFTDEDVAMPAATFEDGTPTDCDITGANGVWYKFTPELNGQITGTIVTPGGILGAYLSVNNGPLAGNYSSVAADFGGEIPADPLTADAAVVIDDDTTGDPNDGCDPVDNGADLSGKIAIVRRGACEFGVKALAAQNEGAVAVIVVNNQPGDPIVMGGGAVGGDVTIPAVMVNDVDGEALIAEVLGGNTVNMTLVSGFDGFSSVTFYTDPDESSSEDELVLVDWFQNQCLPSASATIPVTAGQAYYCFVVNTGSVTDIVFDNCQLGVDSNEIEGFVFYPNPTNDILNLSATQNIEKVALYNLLGQRVIDMNVEATQTQIGVSNLATGAYIMEVTVDGQKGTYKVIKN